MTATTTQETTMILTPAQNETIVTELVRFQRNLQGLAKVEIHESVYGRGAVTFSFNHPGVKADGSDWSWSTACVLPDGSFWDTDPVKPWELA